MLGQGRRPRLVPGLRVFRLVNVAKEAPEHIDEGRFVWRQQVMAGVQPRDAEVGDAGTAVPLGIFACQQSVSATADREHRTADRRQLIPHWHVR